ncbi:MAG: hypothetical protein RQ739_08040, partial [Desulfotignum sp.]|nr:hypothetical protein [Desulfotignum sp.]
MFEKKYLKSKIFFLSSVFLAAILFFLYSQNMSYAKTEAAAPVDSLQQQHQFSDALDQTQKENSALEAELVAETIKLE